MQLPAPSWAADQQSSEVVAPSAESAPSRKGFEWKHFRGFFTSVAQGSGLSFPVGTYTGGGSFNPEFRFGFSDRFALRGDLGFWLPNALSSGYTPIIDLGARAHFSILSWLGVEAGGGMQMWLDNPGFFADTRAGIVFQFPKRILWVLENIHLNAGYLFQGAAGMTYARLGIGIGF